MPIVVLLALLWMITVIVLAVAALVCTLTSLDYGALAQLVAPIAQEGEAGKLVFGLVVLILLWLARPGGKVKG